MHGTVYMHTNNANRSKYFPFKARGGGFNTMFIDAACV